MNGSGFIVHTYYIILDWKSVIILCRYQYLSKFTYTSSSILDFVVVPRLFSTVYMQLKINKSVWTIILFSKFHIIICYYSINIKKKIVLLCFDFEKKNSELIPSLTETRQQDTHFFVHIKDKNTLPLFTTFSKIFQ